MELLLKLVAWEERVVRRLFRGRLPVVFRLCGARGTWSRDGLIRWFRLEVCRVILVCVSLFVVFGRRLLGGCFLLLLLCLLALWMSGGREGMTTKR